MIRVENLSKSYGQKTLFRQLSYHFPQGERIALVGPNGCGKSTLLQILTGQGTSDSGDIIRPKNLQIGFLPQEPNPDPKPTVLQEVLTGDKFLWQKQQKIDTLLASITLDASQELIHTLSDEQELFASLGGNTWESRAKGFLGGLGFSVKQQSIHPKTLSGGWRMRLELAKIFLSNPDFLILDEPTNHLDLPSLAWVENYLQSFEGTTLFVSHDKMLLNRLATVTLHLNHGNLKPYVGNFDSFLDQYEKDQEQLVSQLELLQKKKSALQNFVDRFGAKATKAKQAASKAKQIARLEAFEESFQPDASAESISFELVATNQSGKEILRLDSLTIGYDSVLCKDISLKIYRGQKVALIGQNGIGKSTLLKTIMDQVKPISGSFEFGYNVESAYFAQDQLETFKSNTTILENLAHFSDMSTSIQKIRSLLGAFLFKNDDVHKLLGVLSGGEKSRVGLCALFLQHANFLILDEPTNHLDMTSCEILTQAIQNFEGTVLYVSHDRNFIDETATHVMVITPTGEHQVFEGNLEDYERLCELTHFPNILKFAPNSITRSTQPTEDVSESKTSFENQKKYKRDRQKLTKEMDHLESEMTNAKSQIQNLKLSLEDEAVFSDFKKIHSVEKNLEILSKQLETFEDQWLQLAEKLDALNL